MEFLERSMNMRVATHSTRGVPHLTPLRFVYDGSAIYSFTGAASPTVRHLRGRPEAVLLFDAEQRGPDGTVLRIRAHAAIRSEPHLRRWFERRAATKYFLRPGAVWNALTHWQRIPAWLRNARSTTPESAALIEFVPETAEFVPRPL